MPDRDALPSDLLKRALQRTANCPPVEALERLLETADAALSTHVSACAYCKTELELLRSFRQAEVPAEDAEAIRTIAQRLSRPALVRPRRVEAPRRTSWRFGGSWLRPSALAAAGILLIVSIGLQFRHAGPPKLRGDGGSEVFRSRTITVLSPSGDLQRPPEQVRWEQAPSAAMYQVRLLEVDGNELWSAKTSNTSIAFPPSIRALMLPAKTLSIAVEVYNAQGQKIAQSENVRFRILQNIYPR